MQRVLLAGATGMIGKELGLALVRRGVEVSLLSRDPRAAERLPFPARIFPWAGDGHPVPSGALTDVDAVVNLTGESIAHGRWTVEKKKRLRVSRLGPARALTAAILAAERRPSVYLQASAAGYYGDTGETPVDETSAPGRDLLARLCVDWEQAAQPLADQGLRVVFVRLGMVLSLTGGALPQLAALYRLGLGAVPSSGQQWVSWIHIDDVVQLCLTALTDARCIGPINAVATHPCRFLDLSRELSGRAGLTLHAPQSLVRLALGEAAGAVLTSSRVKPLRIEQLGLPCRYGDLHSALDHLLGAGSERTAAWEVSRQWIPAPPRDVARFYVDEKHVATLTPPWLRFNVLDQSTPEVGEGTRIRGKLRLHGLPFHWESLITGWRPGTGFVDEQVTGPYALWQHQHVFEPLDGGTLVTDRVRYKVPLGRLGALAAGWLVDRDVKRIFAFRRQAVCKYFPRTGKERLSAAAPQKA